jgi:hypothetical protein
MSVPILGLSNLVRINYSPLQAPGTHTKVREVDVGGEGDSGDRRMFLSVRELEELLAVARSSLTGRVVMHGVSLRVATYQDRKGHRYDVLKIGSSHVEPEPAPLASGHVGT